MSSHASNRRVLAPSGYEADAVALVLELATFVAAAAAAIGTLRLLPLAYGAYALTGLIFAISAPKEEDAFLSLPRFTLALFPLFMWLGHWTHTRARTILVGTSWALLLPAATALFATWHFVA
jgi:hypothetical protein